MAVVKRLTEETGITVVCTIHSPTPYTFNLFDDIMILLRGRVAYFGANGPAAKLYFERTNPDAPAFGSQGTSDNLAEWIVGLTTSVSICLLRPLNRLGRLTLVRRTVVLVASSRLPTLANKIDVMLAPACTPYTCVASTCLEVLLQRVLVPAVYFCVGLYCQLTCTCAGRRYSLDGKGQVRRREGPKHFV